MIRLFYVALQQHSQKLADISLKPPMIKKIKSLQNSF